MVYGLSKPMIEIVKSRRIMLDSSQQYQYCFIINITMFSLEEKKLLLIIDDNIILLSVVVGDLGYFCYYKYYKDNTGLMIIFIIYTVFDGAFVVIVDCFKYRQNEACTDLRVKHLFHLLSELEMILILFIPIFTSYEVESTNCIAFFILHKLFYHSYMRQDLLSPRISSTFYDHRAQKAHHLLLSIRSEHKFCAFFVHQQRTGANKVELLVHSEVDAEFYGESFGNKT
jgi:hypothetical protein